MTTAQVIRLRTGISNFDGQTLISAQPRALMTAFAQDTAKQSQWRGFRRRNLLDDTPENLLDVVDCISTFLAPVMEAIVLGKTFSGVWKHPGPWRDMEKRET